MLPLILFVHSATYKHDITRLPKLDKSNVVTIVATSIKKESPMLTFPPRKLCKVVSIVDELDIVSSC